MNKFQQLSALEKKSESRIKSLMHKYMHHQTNIMKIFDEARRHGVSLNNNVGYDLYKKYCYYGHKKHKITNFWNWKYVADYKGGFLEDERWKKSLLDEPDYEEFKYWIELFKYNYV